jgi:hypothetical protein
MDNIFKNNFDLLVMAHPCNASNSKAGQSGIQLQPGLQRET